MHECGEHARSAFTIDARNEIHARADDVERPDHGELEPVVLAVGPDDSLKQLLGRGVGPALAVNGAEKQGRLVLVHLGHAAAIRRKRAPAVDLARGKMDEPALALGAQFDQGHEVGVAGVDHVERTGVVESGIAHGRE